MIASHEERDHPGADRGREAVADITAECAEFARAASVIIVGVPGHFRGLFAVYARRQQWHHRVHGLHKRGRKRSRCQARCAWQQYQCTIN
jgi:hypothetical protein